MQTPTISFPSPGVQGHHRIPNPLYLNTWAKEAWQIILLNLTLLPAIEYQLCIIPSGDELYGDTAYRKTSHSQVMKGPNTYLFMRGPNTHTL